MELFLNDISQQSTCPWSWFSLENVFSFGPILWSVWFSKEDYYLLSAFPTWPIYVISFFPLSHSPSSNMLNWCDYVALLIISASVTPADRLRLLFILYVLVISWDSGEREKDIYLGLMWGGNLWQITHILSVGQQVVKVSTPVCSPLSSEFSLIISSLLFVPISSVVCLFTATLRGRTLSCILKYVPCIRILGSSKCDLMLPPRCHHSLTEEPESLYTPLITTHLIYSSYYHTSTSSDSDDSYICVLSPTFSGISQVTPGITLCLPPEWISASLLIITAESTGCAGAFTLLPWCLFCHFA